MRQRPSPSLGDNRPFTLHQASLVRQWSADVVFFPHRITLAADERERLIARGIRIVDGEVARLVVDDDRLSGVELTDGQLVPRTAVFVGPRFVPRDELLTALGCDVGENGWVATDPTGRTSVAGVWAAGNVVDSPAQMITALARGRPPPSRSTTTCWSRTSNRLLRTLIGRRITRSGADDQVGTALATSRAR